jgi:hypothetical protein
MDHMKLSDYLKATQQSLAEFAATCGTSTSTMLRVRDGDVVPSRRVMTAIWRASNGQVTPNDVLNLHPFDESESTQTLHKQEDQS